MARLAYAVSGTGRGHVGRAVALVPHLRERHELVLLGSGEALPLLRKLGAHQGCGVRELAGLALPSAQALAAQRWQTRVSNLALVFGLPHEVRATADLLSSLGVDALICDCEPLSALAARQLDLPMLCLDHQHVLALGDQSALPPALAHPAYVAGAILRAVFGHARRWLVSAFFRWPLARAHGQVEQLGGFVGSWLGGGPTLSGDALLAYVRPGWAAPLLAALARLDLPCDVYGLGERPSQGRLHFHDDDSAGFAARARAARAIVGSAGNQLPAEALWLRKPCVLVPEPNHFEQGLNAWYAARIPGFSVVQLDRLSGSTLAGALARSLEAGPCEALRRDDTAEARRHIESWLAAL